MTLAHIAHSIGYGIVASLVAIIVITYCIDEKEMRKLSAKQREFAFNFSATASALIGIATFCLSL